MPEIKDVGESNHIFMCLHSDPGAGKTTFIGSGGKQYKILIIRSPLDHTTPIRGSGVKEMVVHDWPETFEAMEHVRHEGHNWDWVWVDSFSLLSDMGLQDVYNDVVDSKGGRSGARAKFGPDKGEYGVNMWRLAEWVRYAVSADQFNLGLTCHSFWYTPFNKADEEMDEAIWPWIQGKMMPERISGMMNVIAHMAVRKREVRGQTRESRVMYFNKTERIHAKCQFKNEDGTDVFPDGMMFNPTLPDLMEKLGVSKLQTAADRRRGGAKARPTGRRPAGAAKPVVRRTTRRSA